MNILLIRPRPAKETINLQSFMICEPLELEYAAAYAEQSGHSVDIVDMILERKPLEYFIRQKKYDLAGITGYLPHINIIKDYAARLKAQDPGLVILAAGVQAEVRPADLESRHIDFILTANSLKSFKDVLDRLEAAARLSDRPLVPEALAAIRMAVPGVWDPSKQEYEKECVFPYPFPDRSKTKKYRSKYNYIYHDRCATLKTSFGCAYNCEFCFCIEITGRQYFERPLPEVIEEIKGIAESNIFIVDDNFLYRPERVLEFCRLLKDNGLRKNFILFGRADFISAHEDVIRELKSVGLGAIFVGIESFREQDLRDLSKGTSVAVNLRAVEIVEGLGLHCYCGIIAAPDWQRKDFDALIQQLKGLKHPMINLQPLTPVPGTRLYAKEAGLLREPLSHAEVWDMGHVLFQPVHMSVRRFYANILRVYLKTSAGPAMHWYIVRRYGLRVYLRTLKGACCIAWQYVKLMVGAKA